MSAAMNTRLFQISALCAVVFLALSAYGQAVNATLLGTVNDPTGSVVPSAKVTVTEVNTGINHTGRTNESGNYTFPDLPPGFYSVTIEVSGFKTETRRDITLLVNSSTRVDVRLQTGNVSERIEVTGEVSLLQTCLLYTSPSPRDVEESRMPSSA